ncbi:MAG: T9SS type A sorting domain-containing protein [Flavobacteriaceae bacterium]|nr:T9SS type A sorting domain-containing protein [Flavobacteriaceae bacterium]
MRTTLIKFINTIAFMFFIGITSLSAQTTLVDPEWEFFDDFEGTVDNTFWKGNGVSMNYGVNRPDASSKVLESVYIPNSEGNGDSWSEYDFLLGIDAVQVEISFKMFTPADYVPIELNHKFFYLWSGLYGSYYSNIAVNTETWSNGVVALPAIHTSSIIADSEPYRSGHSFNTNQIPIYEEGDGEWSTYQIFLELATEDGDYGYYEVFKDGVYLTATYEPTLNNWGWTGSNPDFDGDEMIPYATITSDAYYNQWGDYILSGGNFINQGTLLGWANGDPDGGFLVDTKFLFDDFRIRANATFGATTLSINDETIENTISIFPNPTYSTFTIHLKDETLEKAIIYNHLGQQIKKETTNKVDISNLSNGVYFVKITSQSGKTATGKVIKY